MFVALLSSRGADAPLRDHTPAQPPRPSYAVAPSVISEATTARGEQAGRRNPKGQGRDDGSAPGAGYKNKLRAVARGVVRGLEVLEVLHRAAPAAGVRHQSEPDLVLSMFMVRRDAVSLSFGAAHPFIEKNP